MKKFKIICNKCNSECVDSFVNGYEEAVYVAFECINCGNKIEYDYDEEMEE